MAKINLSVAEIDLLLNAMQTWKEHTERKLIYRQENGWDNQEQLSRIQAIDELQERLYAIYHPK